MRWEKGTMIFCEEKFAKDLDRGHISVNKNMIPFNTEKPLVTSNFRMSTPAVTSRCMGTQDMERIAQAMDKVLSAPGDEKAIEEARNDMGHSGIYILGALSNF